jgi:hypothetical protein
MKSQKIDHELQSTRFKQRKLIAREIGDELLLFDEQTSTAHCLNGIAGEMWTACEAESSAADITDSLCSRWPELKEDVVEASLSHMADAGLLEETEEQEIVSMSRRNLVRKMGLAAAVALPIVVTSVLIPPAASAASCGKTGAICGLGQPPCCAGFHCLATLVCAPS